MVSYWITAELLGSGSVTINFSNIANGTIASRVSRFYDFKLRKKKKKKWNQLLRQMYNDLIRYWSYKDYFRQ